MTTHDHDLFAFRRDLRAIGERALGLQRHPEGSPARAAALCDLLLDYGGFPAQARALGLDEGLVGELTALLSNARENLRRSLPQVRERAVFESLCFTDGIAEDLAGI
jgi:hypothetical protein